jgi:hypothetical protein
MEMKDVMLRVSKIAECEDLSPVTRGLAKIIIRDGYITVGTWLRALNDADVEYLSDVIELDESDDPELFDQAQEEIVLLTMMLINGEGLFPESFEELSNHTGYFKMMVAGASLARRGLVRAFYENMSFGEDSKDLPIFERL